jgi:hypothetical protein
MRGADERQQVVFAHAVETDVAHQNKLIVLLGKNSLEMTAWIQMQTLKQFRIHPRDTRWCFQQTLSVRIFSNRSQYFANGSLNAREIDLFPHR